MVDPAPRVGQHAPLRRFDARVAVLAVVAVVVAVGVRMVIHELDGSTSSIAVVASDRAAATLQFEIPADVAARLERGEKLDVVPSPLRVRVGEVLRIRNLSGHGQYVGPFFVAARSVLSERFTAPGTLQGECVLHPSGRLVIHVER